MNVTQPAETGTTGRGTKPDRKLTLERRGVQVSLKSKLLLLITGITVTSALVSACILYFLQRQQLIANTQTSVKTLSDAIETNLQHAMLTNEREMINDVIRTSIAGGNLEEIRILNDASIIKFSSNSNEVGILFEREAPICQTCHRVGAPSRHNPAIYTASSGRQTLVNVNLIQNRAECQECHTQENKILGLLMIESSMTSLNRQLSVSLVQIILLMTGTSAILIGLIVPVIQRNVIRPVGELTKATAEISANNLDYQVKVDSQDELGELAGSFEKMRLQLKETHLEMERRNRELSVLNEVGLNTSHTLDLQEILDSALETVTEKLMMEVGLIFLREPDSDHFVLYASRGASMALCQEIERRRSLPDRDISNLVVTTDHLFYVADLSTDLRFDGLWEDLHNRSFINVPLRSKGKIVGTMSLTSPAGKPIPERLLAVVEAVGNQIGVVIENAQLYRQLRFLAILEERDRLARELHDSLAQALGYINVKASITNDLLFDGSIAQAQESLQELKKVANVLYIDIRETIFNLRTVVSSQLGFVPTLQEYLEEYRTSYGLDIQLLVGYTEIIELPQEMTNQLMRVIQEALTNVRKHANANKVRVHYHQDSNQICVQIEDDGQGFDPLHVQENGRQHVGLQIMKERMTSIRGSLNLVSQPGQGTRVILQVPVTFPNFKV